MIKVKNNKIMFGGEADDIIYEIGVAVYETYNLLHKNDVLPNTMTLDKFVNVVLNAIKASMQ